MIVDISEYEAFPLPHSSFERFFIFGSVIFLVKDWIFVIMDGGIFKLVVVFFVFGFDSGFSVFVGGL